MEKKDFLKLRAKIHEDFKKWFSYSTKYRILYCDWSISESELNRLFTFLKPFGVHCFFDGSSVMIG